MPFINYKNHYLQHKKNPFCVHEKDFTNAVFVNKLETFDLSLSQTNSKSWEEITNSSHYSLVDNDNDKKRIKNYLDLSKKKFNNLKIELKICQIPIGEGEKFRAFVVFKNHCLLELLFFDPNHHFYPNFSPEKFKFPCEEGKIACLMKEENCGKAYEKPLSIKEWRRKITKERKKH